jgi:hypothetical protein
LSDIFHDRKKGEVLMNNQNKVFQMFVDIFVMATGAVFGAWAGLLYQKPLTLVVGTIAGALISYPLAGLYLKRLSKTSVSGESKIVISLLGSWDGMICGIICTTVLHLILIAIPTLLSHNMLYITYFSKIMVTANTIGACAGLVVGGICSGIYVLGIMKNRNETA